MSHVTGNETDAEKVMRLQGLVTKLEKELKQSEANCNRIIAAKTNGEILALQNPGDPEAVVQLSIQVSNLEAELTNAQRTVKGYSKECHEVEQFLGQAMGYPWYKDDQKNFPDTTDADGVCTGDHTPSTLAQEAGTLIVKLKQELQYERDNSIPPQVIDQMREELQIARDAQIGIFDMDYPPVASQGAPTHEVVDVLTADTVNFWIQRIESLTQGNAELEAQNQALQIAINRQETGSSSALETHNNILQGVRSDNMWRTRRISVLENCLRWALRLINHNLTNPIGQRDHARAHEMFVRLFSPNENPERMRFSERMGINNAVLRARVPPPPAHIVRDDGQDAYAMMAHAPADNGGTTAWGGGGGGPATMTGRISAGTAPTPQRIR